MLWRQHMFIELTYTWLQSAYMTEITLG